MAHLFHGHTSKNTPNTKIFKKVQLLTETVDPKTISFPKKDKDSLMSRATHEVHFSFKLTGSMKSN